MDDAEVLTKNLNFWIWFEKQLRAIDKSGNIGCTQAFNHQNCVKTFLNFQMRELLFNWNSFNGPNISEPSKTLQKFWTVVSVTLLLINSNSKQYFGIVLPYFETNWHKFLVHTFLCKLVSSNQSRKLCWYFYVETWSYVAVFVYLLHLTILFDSVDRNDIVSFLFLFLCAYWCLRFLILFDHVGASYAKEQKVRYQDWILTKLFKTLFTPLINFCHVSWNIGAVFFGCPCLQHRGC